MPGKIITTLLCAATGGVLLGMLLAPKTGGEFRSTIANSVSDMASRFVKLLGKQKEAIDNSNQP